jgi:nitrous oxidase accessory protein NosD
MPRTLFAQTTLTTGIKQMTEFEGDAVTPADGTDLPGGPCTAINVTGAGNVNINLAGGGTAVLTGLSAGQTIRVNATRILATSTTATGISALYPAGNL